MTELNEEINEKYLEEIDETNERHVKNDYVLDNESYHIEMDELLVNFLKELGYEEIAEKYNKASDWFWYS